MASFSIIIPVYKVERYLRQCLDSIVNQSYKDFEVILIDDGSPDQCGAIADEYAQRDARFRVVHQENKGVCIARKIGIQHASKPYVTWVDGDDYIGPDVLKTLNSIVEEYAPDMIAFGYRRVKDDGTVLFVRMNEMESEKLYYTSTPGFYDRMIYDRTRTFDGKRLNNPLDLGLCGKAFRRDLLTECLLDVPDEVRLGEDMAAVFNTLCKCETLYVSKMSDYYYRMNQQSISSAFDLNELQRKRVLFQYLNRSAEKIPQVNKDIYAFRHTMEHFINAVKVFDRYDDYRKYVKSQMTVDLRTVIKVAPYPKMPAKQVVLFFLLKRHWFYGYWLIFHVRKQL